MKTTDVLANVAIVTMGVLLAGFVMNSLSSVSFIRDNVHSGFDS